MTRVAVVTGAARGIGAATVDALVNDGYRVVGVDRCRDIPEVPYALATPGDLDAVVARKDMKGYLTQALTWMSPEVRVAAQTRKAS